MYGLSPLASRADGEFARMVLSYQEALSSAVERREFRGAEPASSKLRSIADALGYQRAGPRDLVAIHTLALRNKLETVPAGRKQIYIEEARFTVLELMGYLLAHYRNQAIGSKAARE
jgi:hypothetical protein